MVVGVVVIVIAVVVDAVVVMAVVVLVAAVGVAVAMVVALRACLDGQGGERLAQITQELAHLG